MMKILRFFFKCFFALILVALILWTVILGTLQTKQGQKWAFRQVTDYFERKTQKQIKIKNMTFSFPLQIHLEEIAILQEKQPILTIKNFSLTFAYTQLLQGRIVFSKVQAEDVDIFEIPFQSDLSSPNDPISWDAPPLPVYVKIVNLDIQKLRLAPKIIDALKIDNEMKQRIKQSSLNLSGSIKNNPFLSTLDAHLLMTLKNDAAGVPPISLGLDAQNHHMSLSIHFNQLPLQVLKPDFPYDLKANLALFASAPVSTWQSFAQNSSSDKLLIEGHFKLTLDSFAQDKSLISALLEQQTLVRGHYLLKSNQTIELADLKIENPNFVVKGNSLFNLDHLLERGHFHGKIFNLENFKDFMGKEVKGNLNFDLQASGPLLAPSWLVQLESPSLAMAEQIFQNVHATIQSASLNGNKLTDFSIHFNHQDIPWKAAALLDWNDPNKITLSQLKIETMHSHLDGEMSCFLPDMIWEGFVEARIGNFNDLSPFVQTPINGKGLLKVQFATMLDSDRKKKQEIDGELTALSLEVMDWQAPEINVLFHMGPSNQRADFFQIQSWMEGKQMRGKDVYIETGSGNLIATLDPSLAAINDLSTEWTAHNIQWQDRKALHAFGQIKLHNPQQLEGQLEFTLQHFQTPTLELEELSGLTMLPLHPSKNPFSLKGKGVWKEDYFFALNGSWHYQERELEIQVQQMNGRFGPYPLQLKQPVQFMLQDQEIKLSKLWLQWGEAEIQADFQQDRQNISGHIKTNAVPSELFHFVAPDLPLVGRASFEGQLEGTAQHPKGLFQVDLHHMQITEDIFTKNPFIAGKLLLNLDEAGIHLKSQLTGIGQTPLLITGDYPLHLSLNPLSFQTDLQKPFDLYLNAEGELDPYLHLFYNDTTNLSGQAKIALKASGQINSPKIEGRIDLINGAYESLSTGTLYHNIQAHLEGNGSKILLTHLSAQDNKNGQISATGSLNLDPIHDFPFDFQIQPSHISIIDSDYVDISASGKLTLSGNTKQSKLQGELTVDHASIDLEGTLPRQIKTIDINYINVAKNDSFTNQIEKQKGNSHLELDVKLIASQSVNIHSKDLKSQWKGILAVNGTPENPQLHGDLRIAEGQYDFNGKIFQISQGNIHFAGPVDKKTTLYVSASKELDRITAEIIVKGPVKKPVISFRSNPPLSQREVLSYILFNRGISDITSDQGEQLSQSFISLNSSSQTKSGDDFLTRLRKNIGIDRLDFTTGDNQENKNFGLQVGKHITEDIMVSVNQSMTSLSPIIAIEAKLRKNLKAQIQAGMGEEAPVRMSIKWKKDY